jgi:drug/metabolite transporter (DMT)-like permease
MAHYLPGIILAVCGALAYAIGCLLYIAYRREKDPARKNKTLMIYGLALMGLGVVALGGGLYSLEINQFHALGQ